MVGCEWWKPSRPAADAVLKTSTSNPKAAPTESQVSTPAVKVKAGGGEP
jgi:hypothetical protein